MPHIVLKAEAFSQHCRQIQSPFSSKNYANWFVGHEGHLLPIDSLPLLDHIIREKIRAQKYLNLPGQRVIVPILRCNELKHKPIKKVKPVIENLRERADEERLEFFARSADTSWGWLVLTTTSTEVFAINRCT